MTDYEQTLTENIYTNDVFFKRHKTEIGLTIDGICLDDAWDSIHVVEKLNELASAEIRLGYTGEGIWSADAEQKIMVGKELVVYYGASPIFKGTVTEIKHNSDETTTVKALACGNVNGKSLVNYDFRVLSNNRYRETTPIAAKTILSKIASENVNGSSPWIINVGVNDITTTTTFNVENISRWEACKQLAKLVDNQSDKFVKLWISNNDTINMTYLDKPSPDGSGTSVKAFYTYGPNQNCDGAFRDEDKSQLWNVVTVKGYGEGTQQLTSAEYSDANSIAIYGRHEKVWVDKRIRDVTAANNLAQKILNEHKNPIKRFVLAISDLDEVLPDTVEVGDIVTIYDDQVLSSNESKDYVVVGRNIDFTFDGYRVTLECHSKIYSFVEEVYSIEESLQTQEGTAIINDPGHSHGKGTYEAALHSHTAGEYEAASHTHAVGTYAVANHTHDKGTYSIASHTHASGAYGADAHGASDQGYYFGIYSNTISTTGSWVSVGTQINLGSYTYLFHGVWGFIQIDFDADLGYSWACAVRVRVKNLTDGTYYPDSNGLTLTLGFTLQGLNTIILPFYIHIPHNWTSDSYILQYYIENPDFWSSTGALIRYGYHGSRGHTHSISGSSGPTAPDFSGSSGFTAPDISGSSEFTAPGISGSSGFTAPDVSGESSSNTTGVTG